MTWSSAGSETFPAGPGMASTTTVSVPYSYRLDGASCVPNIVSQTAGANKNFAESNGACSPTTPTASPSSPRPPSPSASSSPRPPSPSPSSPPSGPNLSIGAGSDGSSKADGTSYGNVRDGNMSTYWSPVGSTGDISIKWSSARTISRIIIREASGAVGNIGSWQVINADTGAVLRSGSGAGTITFTSTSLTKVTFRITSSTATPRVAEYETYAA